MTLLTLEEIEKVSEYPDVLLPRHIGKTTARRLLATARAYWELKNEPATLHSTSIQYIGQLRQWLNECRITDPSKMVDNKDIMEWLGIPVPEGYRTDKEVISEALGIKEDKPHARTIKAIVEALRDSWDSDEEIYQLGDAIQALKDHLE